MDIKLLSNLKAGSLELTRLVKIMKDGSLFPLKGMIENNGLIINQIDETILSGDWKVGLESATQISIMPGKALCKDVNGYSFFANLPNNLLFTMTTDGVFDIIMKGIHTNDEIGTVSVINGTTEVVGIGTEFTKILGINRRIIIGSNILTILNVNSDTNLTLASNFTGTTVTDSKFQVGGWFIDYPTGIQDNIIYEYDNCIVYSQDQALNIPNNVGIEYILATVTVLGGVITDLIDKRKDYLYKPFSNSPSITETPSHSFKVGGRYVQLEEDVPQLVKNIKVTDISGTKPINIDISMQDKISFDSINQGTNSNILNVKLDWGYKIPYTGLGGTNTLTFQSDFIFANNELTGYYLYLGEYAKSLKITSNLATSSSFTTLTVEEEGGAVWLGSGNYNNLRIHSNADSYEVIAIPIITDLDIYDYENIIEKRISFRENNFTLNEAMLQLVIGSRYMIRVKAIKGTISNNYVEMEAGSYIKYGQVQSYNRPFLVKHPFISDTGVNVSCLSTLNGFRVVVNTGWSEAEKFEVVYCTDLAENANFFTIGNTKKSFVGRSIEISSEYSRTYYVRVRPLIAGQEVGTPFPFAPTSTFTVVSGNYGMQNEKLISQTYIQNKTYSGMMTVYDIYEMNTLVACTIINDATNHIYSPADSTAPQNIVASLGDLTGKYITLNNSEFVVNAMITPFEVELKHIGISQPITVGTTYPFGIGTTKRARQISITHYPLDYEILHIDFDCDVKRGLNSVLRVYQQGIETSVAKLEISETGIIYPLDCSVLLSGDNGARNMVVDLYDDAGTLNKGELAGTLSIYAKTLYHTTQTN